MRTTIFLLGTFLFLCCRDAKKRTPPRPSDYVDMDTSVNYVKFFFNKKNWSYPVYIDTCDTCLAIEYYVNYIVKNKYNTSIKAFKEIIPKLEMNNNVAYELKYTHVYKESGDIFYSILVIKYKNNLKRDMSCMDCGYIDSNRIMASSNRAIFIYKNNNLSFVKWTE